MARDRSVRVDVPVQPEGRVLVVDIESILLSVVCRNVYGRK
jgi:hypothetical protein